VRQGHAVSPDAVAAAFLASGWRLGQPGGYRAELAVDTAELYTFLGATQPHEWERLIVRYDDADVAQRRFARRVAAELDRRGTLDVLRRGVTDWGITIRLADQGPGAGATRPSGANRLSVIPHLHYAPSRPSRTLDLVVFVNGIPVATAQVADAPGATAADAAERFARCDPREPLLRARALVHLAVGPDGILAATQPDPARFVPLTGGSALPGREFWAPAIWLGATKR
jgi:type I restriction enzyme R subunit